MKKYCIFFIVFCTIQNIFSQNEYPLIETTSTNHTLFKASLGKEAATFYLKKIKFAPLSTGVYSVEGWVKKTSLEKKKTVVGVYDGNSLILYHFKEVEKRKAILNFISEGNSRSGIQAAKEATDFIFKIVFRRTDKGVIGSYKSTGKKQKMHLTLGTLAAYKEQRILQLNSKNSIDLLQLSRYYKDAEIIASNNQKVLLSYIAPSTLYSNGRCAAGEEKGFLTLTFDKYGLLKNTENVVIESCLIGITTNKEEKETALITHYFISNDNTDTHKKVSINLKNSGIRTTELVVKF